jgi:hypothetical protein
MSVRSISLTGFQLTKSLMDGLLVLVERQSIELHMERISLPEPSRPITTTKIVELRVYDPYETSSGPTW